MFIKWGERKTNKSFKKKSIYAKMTDLTPRINFAELKGYPELPENNKINTSDFLESSSEIIGVIDSFGKLFSPVVSDMRGNVEKIKTKYVKDKVKYLYLEDMILDDAKVWNAITESLLWLKRALELIEGFFSNILKDTSSEDNLKRHLKSAYETTLQPHHGFLVQQTFSIIYRWVPSRTTLVGSTESHKENYKALERYLPPMKTHLDRLNNFFTELKLDEIKTSK